jgi:hypothetical protein
MSSPQPSGSPAANGIPLSPAGDPQSRKARSRSRHRAARRFFRGLCHTKISVTLEPITSEQATKGQRAAPHTGAGLQLVKVKLPARVACKSMNRAQKHLAQANWHIAELTVQIVRQRVIVKHALDTGQRSEMAESLLDALEGSLRIFEKHRIFLLRCGVKPSE